MLLRCHSVCWAIRNDHLLNKLWVSIKTKTLKILSQFFWKYWKEKVYLTLVVIFSKCCKFLVRCVFLPLLNCCSYLIRQMLHSSSKLSSIYKNCQLHLAALTKKGTLEPPPGDSPGIWKIIKFIPTDIIWGIRTKSHSWNKSIDLGLAL